MSDEKIINYPLEIPFKDFMPGQVIQSGQFNDDMAEIEEKVNEVVEKHNTLTNETDNHISNKENPHEVTAHQVGAYSEEEVDAYLEDIRNGGLYDKSIENRVLDDECVETRNIKNASITSIKVDSNFGSQINISKNIDITDRYTKKEVNDLLAQKVGEGTYSKEELDQMFEDVQAGQIVDGTIDVSKLKDNVGKNLDISVNPSITDRYTKAEVNVLIQENGLPRDWGGLDEIVQKQHYGHLPVANVMTADEFIVPLTPVLDIDVKEVVEARGTYKSLADVMNNIKDGIVKAHERLDNLGDISGGETNGNVGSSSVFENQWVGKVWNALGDSITEVNYHTSKQYHQFAKDILGISKVNNYGISGTTIARKSSSDNTAMVERYKNMDNNADLITVAGGINDLGFHIPMGDFDSTDETTFYGALHSLCKGLITKYPTKTIIFITPALQAGYFSSPNNQGNTSRDYANAIIQVCNYYSIPVFDNNRLSGITPIIPVSKSTYTTDGLHWNLAGHERVGTKLAQFIMYGGNTLVYNPNAGGGNDENNDVYTTENIIGKKYVVKGTQHGQYHFTILLPKNNYSNGTDIFVAMELTPINCTLGSGATLFSDASGELTNSSFVGTVSGVCTSLGDINNFSVSYTLNTNVSNHYLKVPIPIKPIDSNIETSFIVNKIETYVDNKLVDVELPIGGFFATEQFEIK